MAEIVHPRLFVEAHDIDNKRVAFPMTHRVTEVSRVELVALGMRPAVHVDLAPDMRGALEDHDDALLLGKLDDLHRIRRRHHAWSAGRKAVAFGIVLGVVRRVVVVDGGRPRLEWHLRLGLRAAATGSACRSLTTA